MRNGNAYRLADLQPERSAEAAGLRYVQDGRRGIRRRAGASFRYLDADGAPIADEATLRRIRRLAIPPAWQDVWICPCEAHHAARAPGARARRQLQFRFRGKSGVAHQIRLRTRASRAWCAACRTCPARP